MNTYKTLVLSLISSCLDDCICVAEWIRSRAVMLRCTTSLIDLGSNPGTGAVNQTVRLSGVGKLVAVSIQRVTAVESCEGQSMRPYDGWRTAACSRRCKIPYVGFLQSARVCEAWLRTVNCIPCIPLPLQQPTGRHRRESAHQTSFCAEHCSLTGRWPCKVETHYTGAAPSTLAASLTVKRVQVGAFGLKGPAWSVATLSSVGLPQLSQADYIYGQPLEAC
jgi:hypothetical protein